MTVYAVELYASTRVGAGPPRSDDVQTARTPGTLCCLITCYTHHWRPNLPGGCCICLEQFAGVSTGIAVNACFSQQTEDRAFCPVVQQLWLRASHCTDYHVTSLLFLRVTCPCSLRTYATLKLIRSSSSSYMHRFSQWLHCRGGKFYAIRKFRPKYKIGAENPPFCENLGARSWDQLLSTQDLLCQKIATSCPA